MILVLAFLLTLVCSVPIASEDFESTVPGVSLDGQGGGFGFGGNWMVSSSITAEVVAASLSFTGGSEVFSDGGSQTSTGIVNAAITRFVNIRLSSISPLSKDFLMLQKLEMCTCPFCTK